MFFSTDLLAQKGGPFARIWLLGTIKKEKLKNPDYKAKISKLIISVREWIRREDGRRCSLYLSSSITYGVIRILHGQISHLRNDVGKSKSQMLNSLRLAKTLTDPIDVPPTEEDLIPEPVPDDCLEKVFNDTANTTVDNHLMREYPHPRARETEDFGQDFGFGDGTFETFDPNARSTLFLDDEEQPEISQVEQPEMAQGSLRDVIQEEQMDIPLMEKSATEENLEKLDKVDQMAMQETELIGNNFIENEANAPGRVTGPPNGCREKSPPIYPEREQEPPIISTPTPPREQELPIISTPPREQEQPIISTPPREQDQPIVDPVVEAPLDHALSLNTTNSSENDRAKKRKAKTKRIRKAKCPKVDTDVQIPMDTVRENLRTYKDWGRDEENWPVMEPKASVNQLETFGRPKMQTVLQDVLRQAAFADKIEDMEIEQIEQENQQIEQENTELVNDMTSDLRQNQDTVLSERQVSIGSRESTSLLNPPEKSIDEPSIDVIAEERSSQMEQEEEQIILDEPIMPPTSPEREPAIVPQDETMPPPSPEAPPAIVPQNESIPLPSPGAPPGFDSNNILGYLSDRAIDFKELIQKMGLERRRDVAFAFFNILELNKDGKITSEQEEFLGPLMIQIV